MMNDEEEEEEKDDHEEVVAIENNQCSASVPAHCHTYENPARRRGVPRTEDTDEPLLSHKQPFALFLIRYFLLSMANIKAETQLNFTTRNTYNDITNILERNNNNDASTDFDGPVEENMLPKDDTKRLLIVKPVDDTMLPNPFGEEQNKHPQIKFHQRQEYIEQAAPVSQQLTNNAIRASSTFATLGSKKHRKPKDNNHATKGQSNLRVASKTHKQTYRRRVGRRQVRKANVKRHKTKKATTKKIFHKGMWLVVPTAGNSFPISKEKLKSKRKRRRNRSPNQNAGRGESSAAETVSKADRRPAWNSSPLLKEPDYNGKSFKGQGHESVDSPSYNHSKSPDLRHSSSSYSRLKQQSQIETSSVVKQSPILRHNRSLNSTQTTHVSMTEVGEDGPLRDDKENNVNRSSYESMCK